MSVAESCVSAAARAQRPWSVLTCSCQAAAVSVVRHQSMSLIDQQLPINFDDNFNVYISYIALSF